MCKLTKEGFCDVEYIPIISNENCQPILAKDVRKNKILRKIHYLSDEYQRSLLIQNPLKNPTGVFFNSLKNALLHKNLRNSMEIFPRSLYGHLFINSFPIVISKIFSKMVGLFQQKYNKPPQMAIINIRIRLFNLLFTKKLCTSLKFSS